MLENRALEIIVIALVVLVLFGAKRLPDSARALGKSLRILKAESRALRDDDAPAEPPTRTGVGPETRTSASKVAPAPLRPADPKTPADRPGAAAQGTPDTQPARTA